MISNATLPTGVTRDEPGLAGRRVDGHDQRNDVQRSDRTGPIVGLTASNSDYANEIFSVFTDFGTPAAGGIPARPGDSGIQGSDWRTA